MISTLLLLSACSFNTGVAEKLPGDEGTVSRLVLLHGDTREVLLELAEGAVVDLDALSTSRFHVEAETVGPVPGSVVFELGGERHSIDDSRPFELEGWEPVAGAYVLRATAHGLPGGGGPPGSTLEVRVQVVRLPAPPSAPGGLTATAVACAQVALSWQPASGGASPLRYRVYRDGSLLREVAGLSATDDAVSGGGSYEYRVSALDALDRESALSAPASATTPVCSDTAAPSVPASAAASASSCNEVSLSWQASTDTGGSGLKGYNVYRDGALLKQVLAPATSTTDSGLSGSTAYAYRVSAVDNANNESAQSAAASVTTPPCSGGLLGAISRTTLTVGTGSIASGTDYEYGPYLAILPDGRGKLAWCDSSAQKVYVRHLDATLATAERADTVLDGFKLFGLAAHPDGRTAVLTVTPAPGSCSPCTASTSCVSCNELHLVQLSATGTISQQRIIDDRLAHSGAFSGGGIALGTHSGVDAYAVMRTVRGAGPASSASAFCASSAGNSGHQWHETWVYRVSDLSVLASGCNVFPCGHSIFRRSVAALPGVSGFGSVCLSDYSGTRTGFNYAENNGWNNRLYNVWSDWPNFVNGGNPSELVPATSGSYLAALSAPQSCASTCATDHHDVAVMEISQSTRRLIGTPKWISAQPGWEKFPHLARYGSSYLLGWVTNDTPSSDFSVGTHFWLAEIDLAGAILAGPQEITSVTSFSYGSTWTTAPDGDVVWPRRASATTLEIVRVNR